MGKRQPRTTQVYELRDGYTIVYFGISYDVERRVGEHARDGRIDFSSCNEISPKLSRASAEELETSKIQTYQKQHSGVAPKYNRNKTL